MRYAAFWPAGSQADIAAGGGDTRQDAGEQHLRA
jgi:hypothetical protein